MKFILILWTTTHFIDIGERAQQLGPLDHVEFTTQAKCEDALKAVELKAKTITGICKPQ